jgi:hypothetical protein
MLNKIGVEAYPVLVNTWLASEISERVPSANIFNHVIVKAIVNGTEYWFDPTISTQEGDLKHTEIPDYGYGLVLDGNLKGLDLITRISNTKTHIQEKLEVEDYDGNAVLKIVTGYYGEDADRTRYSFSQNTLKEIQKNYLQYYQNTYDSITVETSLTFTDNTEQNIFTTFEHYRIKGIWSEGEDKMKLQVSSYHISEKIQPYLVLTSNRIAPLAINFPKDIHHAFEIVFPDNWDLGHDEGGQSQAVGGLRSSQARMQDEAVCQLCMSGVVARCSRGHRRGYLYSQRATIHRWNRMHLRALHPTR